MISLKENPFGIVKEFEQAVCDYTKAKFAVAVDTGSAALFLSMRYLYARIEDEEKEQLSVSQLSTLSPAIPVLQLPKETFISVPMMAIHSGFSVEFDARCWEGAYQIHPLPIWDSALRLYQGMFRDFHSKTETILDDHRYICLSFQYRKHLPIGRGGMILHNDPKADEWFRRARFFGRHEVPAFADPGPSMIGWHMYMEPNRAAIGLQLMVHMAEQNKDLHVEYPDLSKYDIFKTKEPDDDNEIDGDSLSDTD